MDRTTAIAIGVAGGGVVVAMAILGAALYASARSSQPIVTEGSAQQPIQHDIPPPPPPKREPTLGDQKTLVGALRFVSVGAGQPEPDKHSTAALAGWSLDLLQWSDVGVAEDETNYGLAQKNIDSARGKRLCISGTIIQISEETVKGGTLNEGIISSAAGNLFYFLGVASSGNLVGQSWARFCGVVVDKFDYSNSAGGSGHAIDVVGMFDLPENHTRVVARGL